MLAGIYAVLKLAVVQTGLGCAAATTVLYALVMAFSFTTLSTMRFRVTRVTLRAHRPGSGAGAQRRQNPTRAHRRPGKPHSMRRP